MILKTEGVEPTVGVRNILSGGMLPQDMFEFHAPSLPTPLSVGI